MKLPLLTNTNNEQSYSLTMAVLSFNIVSAWLLASIVLPVFSITSMPPFDASDAMAYLTPVLGLYFGRRWSDKSANTNNE